MPFCNRCGTRHSKFDEACPGCGSPVGVGAKKGTDVEGSTDAEGAGYGMEAPITDADGIPAIRTSLPRRTVPDSAPPSVDRLEDLDVKPVDMGPARPTRTRPRRRERPRMDTDRPRPREPRPERTPEAPMNAFDPTVDDIPEEFRDDFDRSSGSIPPGEVPFEEVRHARPPMREFAHAEDGPGRRPRDLHREHGIEFESAREVEFEEEYREPGPARRARVPEEDVDWGPRRREDGYGPPPDRYPGPSGGPPPRHEPTPDPYPGSGSPYRRPTKMEVSVPKSGPITFMGSFTARAGVLVLILSVVGLLLAYNLTWLGVSQERTTGGWYEDEERVKMEIHFDHDLEVTYFHSSNSSIINQSGDRAEGRTADIMRERIDTCIYSLMIGAIVGAVMIVIGLLVDGPRPLYSQVVLASVACVIILLSVLVMYSAATTTGGAISSDLTEMSFHSTDEEVMNDRGKTWTWSDGGSACLLVGGGILLIGLVCLRRAIDDAIVITGRRKGVPERSPEDGTETGWPGDPGRAWEPGPGPYRREGGVPEGREEGQYRDRQWEGRP